MKKIINTPNAPSPIGPYNQAVLAGNTLYISGQISINPVTNEVVKSDVTAQSTQVMKNLKAILEAVGGDFTNVVKSSIFLKDMNDFAEINRVYGSFFTSDFPARETVEVSRLPKDVNLEISMIAVLA